MNKELLRNHIKEFVEKEGKRPERSNEDYQERLEFIEYYQSYTSDKILSMNEEDVYEYLSKLWAMLLWGNKRYVTDKIIDDNGLDNFRKQLNDLVWGESPIEDRWDNFREEIKGMGPAMISEVLCKTHPKKYMLWNRRAYVGLNYLEVENLPRYDYQLTGEVYKNLCDVALAIAEELEKVDFHDVTLLAVDYFIWHELQFEENLSNIHGKKKEPDEESTLDKPEVSKFIHNDIRDKIREIGEWLGFTANIEKKVSEGSKVDTIWESTIGNMGRVIYVFEVQTKGSIDSLILNLLKSLNNPAVQGVVAVSDNEQIEKIKAHARDVKELSDKLKYWDYEEVLKVHESLQYVNESINQLKLVPQGF